MYIIRYELSPEAQDNTIGYKATSKTRDDTVGYEATSKKSIDVRTEGMGRSTKGSTAINEPGTISPHVQVLKPTTWSTPMGRTLDSLSLSISHSMLT